MRLSEDKIKQAILHPDMDIRERAVRYFDKSFSQDTSVVPPGHPSRRALR